MASHGRRHMHDPNSEAYKAYMAATLERMRREYERRRREEAERNARARGTKAIEVDTIEAYPKENAKHHHTEMFDVFESGEPPLVLRRGQSFFMAIRFKRDYNPMTDEVYIDFSIGPNPELSKGTFMSLRVPAQKGEFRLAPASWEVRVTHHDRAVLSIQVFVPAGVSVGSWKLSVLGRSKNDPEAKSKFRLDKDVYILFNPWCKEDLVYMENEDWRREYVLDDVGKIYMGSWKQPQGRRWIFGQFGELVLPACTLLLEKSKLTYAARANPVKVVRAISAMVNSADDDGLITGNWSGNYDDGTAPWMWTGSSAILEQYVKTAGESVKYGQCWVFAGVCNTVCRALGIPSRPVTCYASAHDTDESITIDRYFDKEGEELKKYSRDSIWNFHVWNEVWMARRDLPPGYGGWQAIDATPQETSDGFYQVGPCSVAAVKRGEIGYMYDSPFVFAEVNADIVHWKEDPSSTFGWERSKTLTYHIGLGVLTKKANMSVQEGMEDAEDITASYKCKEGSDEERMAVLNAARSGGLSILFDLPSARNEDVTLKLQDIESVMIGQPFSVTVSMRNESNEQRTVSAVLSASSVYYTGIIARKIKRDKATFVLQPQDEEVLSLTVEPREYLHKLVDFAMVKIYVIANVKETRQTWSEEDDFTVTKPRLSIEIDGNTKVGQPFRATMRFQNPLDVELQDCTLSVEGPGITSAHVVHLPNVPAHGEWVHRETLVPKRAGSRNVVAIFNCRELFDVEGSVETVVQE
ncbi:hemocyte protein-glutamine gamma-glutamyltransferase [Ixodes scapularis]|uniref:hemocyte protein-glutamine gamma-glutamyltransferase n=1 Tax=Ixodes scapularis TaxID=6945 RepID=UPI001C37F122|nr:hemocyte protein-glutamine gamma-glutamyltransferase [Ixodes scapularis]XP_029844836.2 hemocyte protein-glutamine gamma-glutamyltransferase [Ixodes scapularis]